MMKEIKNNNSKIRLDLFIANHYSDISRSKIQKLIISGNIKVDGFLVKPSFMLKSTECITVNNVQINNSLEYLKENIPIKVLYEDESIIAINKDAGIVVHPGAGNLSGTLLNGLLYHYDNLSSINNRPGIIHRLDKDTSGIIIIAKTNEAHFKISEQFANRKIKKVYRAIVWGNIKNDGKVEGFLTRRYKHRTTFRLTENTGKYSITKYKKLNSLPPFSYIELYPLTGRTHQLRVHLSHLGHPIIRDDSYGGGEKMIRSFHQKHDLIINEAFKRLDRFALHAYKISLIHPLTDQKMTFTAPISKDITNVINLFNE